MVFHTDLNSYNQHPYLQFTFFKNTLTCNPESHANEEGVERSVDRLVEVVVTDVDVSVEGDGSDGQEGAETADEADTGHRHTQRVVLHEVDLPDH